MGTDQPTKPQGCRVAGSISALLCSDKVEIARRAFGDALATRVNMNTRLGDVPVQVIREAMAEALEAIDKMPTDTTNVTAWPKATGTPADAPRPIKRPCDWGLEGAIDAAEIQLGTIEAYNRLVAAATALRGRIDAGNIKAQNPLYAVSVRG